MECHANVCDIQTAVLQYEDKARRVLRAVWTSHRSLTDEGRLACVRHVWDGGGLYAGDCGKKAVCISWGQTSHSPPCVTTTECGSYQECVLDTSREPQ